MQQRVGAGAPLPTWKRPKYRIWPPDFYDFNIYTEEKFREKLNYIHGNPVKHGLVKDSADWKYSSFRNYYLKDNSVTKIDKIEI